MQFQSALSSHKVAILFRIPLKKCVNIRYNLSDNLRLQQMQPFIAWGMKKRNDGVVSVIFAESFILGHEYIPVNNRSEDEVQNSLQLIIN